MVPLPEFSDPVPRRFPNPGEAIALLVLVIAVGASVALLFTALGGRSGESAPAAAIFASNMTGLLLATWLGWKMSRAPLASIVAWRRFPARALVPMVLITPALVAALALVLKLYLLLPFPESVGSVTDDFVRRVDAMLRGQPVLAAVAVIVMAPAVEELFFRGLLLGGFLGRYRPPTALALSALFFSVAHLNPVQVPATLLLGFYLGWLYLRTRSLLPCILAHALNNGFVFLLGIAGRGVGEGAPAPGEAPISLVFELLGLFAVLLLLRWLAAVLPRGTVGFPPGSTSGQGVSPKTHFDR